MYELYTYCDRTAHLKTEERTVAAVGGHAWEGVRPAQTVETSNGLANWMVNGVDDELWKQNGGEATVQAVRNGKPKRNAGKSAGNSPAVTGSTGSVPPVRWFT